jgi:hypothetical protein
MAVLRARTEGSSAMRQSLSATTAADWVGFVCRGMVGLWILDRRAMLETRAALVTLLAILQKTLLAVLLDTLQACL